MKYFIFIFLFISLSTFSSEISQYKISGKELSELNNERLEHHLPVFKNSKEAELKIQDESDLIVDRNCMHLKDSLPLLPPMPVMESLAKRNHIREEMRNNKIKDTKKAIEVMKYGTK